MEDTRLGKMLSNGTRYIVPIYQRGYSWKTKQVDEFLTDLENTVARNKDTYVHFFGTMIITNPKNSYHTSSIIDGQQRMTTAVLFLICARNFFDAHKDTSTHANEYYEFVKKHLSPPQDTNSNPGEPALTLSEPNREFFLDVFEHKSMTNDIDSVHKDSNDSNKFLNSAYNQIRDWFKKHSDPNNKKHDIESILKTIDSHVTALFQKFAIYNITCNDEFEAQRIFNLVNNRGIRLSPSDLIKGILFSALSKNHTSIEIMKKHAKTWDDMRKQVTSRNAADYKLDRFFHNYLSVYYSNTLEKIYKSSDRIKPNEIFDAYSDVLKNGIQPDEIIDGLRDGSYVLNRLRKPSPANFYNNDNIIHYLQKIQKINAVTAYPAVIAGYENYLKAKRQFQFEALVMLCFKYHLRVKTIGTAITIGEYQDKIQDIMNAINKEKLMPEIINELSQEPKYYPDDSIVLSNLRQYRVTNTQQSLALLEEAESVHDKKHSPHDTSIEHIMPVKLNDHWIEYIKSNNEGVKTEKDVMDFHKKHVNLLGNQTLLSAKVNNPLSNKPYTTKRQSYIDDGTFAMNKVFSDFPVWNLEAITERQKMLALDIIKAVSITKIPSKVNLK